MSKLIKIALIIGFTIMGVRSGYAQEANPRLCICFDEHSDFLEVDIKLSDSTYTVFKITRKRYETKEIRQRTFLKWSAMMVDIE